MILEGELLNPYSRSFKRKNGDVETVTGFRVLDREAGTVVEVDGVTGKTGDKIKSQVEALAIYNGTLRLKRVGQ